MKINSFNIKSLLYLYSTKAKEIMKLLFLLIAIALLLVPSFTSCEKEDIKPESISVPKDQRH